MAAVITDQIIEIADDLIGCDVMYQLTKQANRARLTGVEISRVACLHCGCVCSASGVVEPTDELRCACCGSEIVAVERRLDGELPGQGIRDLIKHISTLRRCRHCRWRSSADARYCQGCGKPMEPKD